MIMNRYTKSLEMNDDYLRYFVPWGSTISKEATLYPYWAYPIFIKEWNWARLTDVDWNEYIDFQSGLGAILLWLNYKSINDAVISQLNKWVLYSLNSDLVPLLWKKLNQHIPCAEKIRICKWGSDATSGAIRIAKAFTNKSKIFFAHFHGWHDWYYVATNMNRWIPAELKNNIYHFEYNNIESLKKLFEEHKDEVAAVIMEPVNLFMPNPWYLNAVKEIVSQNWALLIFDEVVTGFRFGLGGAQKYFWVTPDIACFSKALWNGFPIWIVAGKADIMDSTQEVITSMTFAQENLSITAALTVINEIEQNDIVWHIVSLGEKFQNKFNELSKQYQMPFECIWIPQRLEIKYSDYLDYTRLQMKWYFLEQSAKMWIIFWIHIFMNYSHSMEDIDKALEVCENIFKQIKSNNIHLEGKLPIELW